MLTTMNLTSGLGLNPLQIKSITDDQWGIEGLYSQQFSVGIFIFLIVCIVVFTFITIKFMMAGSGELDAKGQPKRMRIGEKIMFIAIFLGIAAAVLMAVVQLLQGYLL